MKENSTSFCCVDSCAFPPADDVPFGCGCLGIGKMSEVTYAPVKSLGDEDVKLRFDCCCKHGGVYFTTPDCLSAKVYEKMLCFAGTGQMAIQKPTTCIKGINQEFCVHSACAFPPDDEIPLGCGCMGKMIFGK